METKTLEKAPWKILFHVLEITDLGMILGAVSANKILVVHVQGPEFGPQPLH